MFTSVNTAVACLVAALVSWLVSLGDYSGRGKPPRFGDFEAQRHWLEITLHLPAKQWYSYDLDYWGLDYPPLTAYHSLALGWLADKINPAWVALYGSRGYEGEDLKTFMRLSALVTQFAIYVPAVIAFARHWHRGERNSAQEYFIFLFLMQPSLMLIDHGHFQYGIQELWKVASPKLYNAAMLGFSLWSVVLFLRGRYLLGSIAFCLSLNFKQMALYYALPVFFFLLSKCFTSTGSFRLWFFIKLGVTVITTFGICFLPFLGSVDDVRQVFVRLFPVERGLYEDKVASVWCALSVVVKLKQIFSTDMLVKIR
ncbi:Glucosyltransferase-like protein [Quaeritorhiza haematococci]|nr:Glucosyltransferase-like protein [Quaeritorhiza haematococci]